MSEFDMSECGMSECGMSECGMSVAWVCGHYLVHHPLFFGVSRFFIVRMLSV